MSWGGGKVQIVILILRSVNLVISVDRKEVTIVKREQLCNAIVAVRVYGIELK